MCPAFRESATVEAWLKAHPEVDIVSRDRGKEFAKAATKGAPQSRQVVDRFHMVKNLSEVLREIDGALSYGNSEGERRLRLSWKRQEKSAHAHFQRQPHGSSAHQSR